MCSHIGSISRKYVLNFICKFLCEVEFYYSKKINQKFITKLHKLLVISKNWKEFDAFVCKKKQVPTVCLFCGVIFHTFIYLFTYIGNALKCWSCNSNGTNSKFCEDPFDPSIISDHQRQNSYFECGTPPGLKNPYSHASVQKAVCMKLVRIGESNFWCVCVW